jgi:hypothetical protein
MVWATQRVAFVFFSLHVHSVLCLVTRCDTTLVAQ